MGNVNTKRKPYILSGGICSCGPIFITHPIDLIKVQMQTQKANLTTSEVMRNLYRKHGATSFFYGLGASLYWQFTYCTARFAVYDGLKLQVKNCDCATRLYLSIISGLTSGIVGVPGNVITVRMQSDANKPHEQRRYRNFAHGLYRIFHDEGIHAMYYSAKGTILRSVLITIGANATYDQVKQIILDAKLMEDAVPLHLLASTISAFVLIGTTQPIDIINTRFVNAKPGELDGMLQAAQQIYKSGGLMAFYRGLGPMLLRVCPNNILTFLLYEQARLRLGWLEADDVRK